MVSFAEMLFRLAGFRVSEARREPRSLKRKGEMSAKPESVVVRAIHEASNIPRAMVVQIWTTNGFNLNRARTSPRPYFGNWQPTASKL